MFRWLRRREGKCIVAEPSERTEPVDPIEELLRIVGETEPAQPSQFSGAKKGSSPSR